MPSTSPAARQPAVDATIRIGVVLLTLTTATVHLSLLLPDPAFILNGLGYLALLAALYLPIPHLVPYWRAVRWALIGQAVLTLLLWVAIAERTPLGYATTADELALVALMVLEGRRLRVRGGSGGL